MDDLEKRAKEYSGEYWFSLIMAREVAKQVKENDLSELVVETPVLSDGVLTVRAKG